MEISPVEKLIFLVEDSPVVTDVVRMVARKEGWRMDHSDRVEGVLDRCEEQSPDIFILDINLPGDSGFSLCRKLRADSKTRHTPVIFLTARGDIASRLEGFYSGGSDYVPKPFDPAELRERIRIQFKRSEREASLRAKVAELEDRGKTSRDLTEMVVHDLKNPLSAARTVFHMLREEERDMNPERRNLFRMGESAIETGLRLVQDMLDLGEGRIDPNPEEFLLTDLEDQIHTLFGASAKRSGVRLVIENRGPETVASDPGLLFRILANLLGNAFKFAPAQSEIHLGIDVSGDSLRFSVGDRGSGVPDGEKPQIFNLNFQGDSGHRHSGSGIGLAFCRQAARAMGGEVSVSDRDGGGALFILQLPLTIPAV